MAAETYAVEIDGVVRDRPVIEVAPGVRVALFNLLGDTEVVRAAARALARRLDGVRVDVLVTAGTKSVPLVSELAAVTGLPWVVLRKAYKSYMGETLTAEALSITTGAAVVTEGDELPTVVSLGHLPVVRA